jgi:hypothetical protein
MKNEPEVVRAPLSEPFTELEMAIADMIARCMNYQAIAEEFCVNHHTIKWRAQLAAAKVPGDLPVQVKLCMWYRGASIESLRGDVIYGPPKPEPEGETLLAADVAVS